MLTLNFIKTPDLLRAGIFCSNRDTLILGRSSQSHILVQDPLLNKVHLYFAVRPSGIAIANDKSVCDGYLSNGKKILGLKMHHPGDIIEIGDTTIEIISFEYTHFRPYRDILEETLNQEHKQPELFDKITFAIEQELLSLEKELNS